MCLTFRKKERGRDIKQQQQQRFFDRNYWLQLVNKRSNWAYHNRLRSGPCWWAFLHAAIKKRKTKIWWESLFTFMYQQITLRRRRNVTPISNIWKAAPIRLFRVGPQRTQRITVNEFPFNVIGKSTTAFYQANHGAYSNSGTQVGKQNKDVGAVSQTSFTRVVRRVISTIPGFLQNFLRYF